MTRLRLLALAMYLLALGCGGSFSKGDDRALAVTPSPLLIAAVSPGQSTRAEVVIRHSTGEGAITLTTVRLDTDSADLALEPVTPRTLAPGESLSAFVIYTPSDGLADTGTLVVSADGLPDRQIVVDASPPVPRLRAIPPVVDFGEVPVATTKTTTLTLENAGTLATTLTAIGLETEAGAPMQLTAIPTLPITLAPGERTDVTVTYSPVPAAGDDAHHAFVRVRTDHVATDQTAVAVDGLARNPHLEITPGAIDFGWVAPKAAITRPLTLTNTGTRPIAVTTLAVTDAPEGVTLIGAPQTPFSIAAGEGVSLLARFAPATPGLGPDLGHVTVTSDDPGPSPTRTVPLGGASALPALAIIPSDVVDFGVVAALHRHERSVRLVNTGSMPLRIDSVALGPDTDAGFALAGVPTLPVWLAPSGAAVVRLSHENKADLEGIVYGTLVVTSSDPAAPTAQTSLRARHGAFPLCLPRLDPEAVEFGTVALGTVVDRTFYVSNEGSLPCVFTSVTFADCAAAIGPCEVVFGPSASFTAGEPLPAKGTVLTFGESIAIPVRYRPVGEPGPRAGQPIITFAKGLKPDGYLQYPSPFGAAPAVLRGSAGDSGIVASPADVVFPLTTVGCASAAAAVSVRRFGDAPLALGSVDLSDCQGAFTAGALTLPAPLSSVDPVPVELHFTPTSAGPVSCEAKFVATPASGGTAVVSLLGVGAALPPREEAFHQAAERAVDLLFVVDSSGSMGDEQSALVTGFETLVNEAAKWSVDFQIAVITTDAGEAGVMRRPFSNNASPWTFAGTATVGTNGSGDERGLQTARMALSPEMLGDTHLPCMQDAQCPPGSACVAGGCGGPNRGFLREGALLAIVWISDEDEHACEASVADLAAGLASVVPPGELRTYAIVGDPPSAENEFGGCGGGTSVCPACDPSCYQPGGGPKQGAESGRRYLDAISLLGGQWYSICDFGKGAAPIFEQLGQDAFSPESSFELSEQPAPATITVDVDGAPCTTGWTYDAAGNTVDFALGGPCFPGPDAAVVVRYDALCGGL